MLLSEVMENQGVLPIWLTVGDSVSQCLYGFWQWVNLGTNSAVTYQLYDLFSGFQLFHL